MLRYYISGYCVYPCSGAGGGISHKHTTGGCALKIHYSKSWSGERQGFQLLQLLHAESARTHLESRLENAYASKWQNIVLHFKLILLGQKTRRDFLSIQKVHSFSVIIIFKESIEHNQSLSIGI